MRILLLILILNAPFAVQGQIEWTENNSFPGLGGGLTHCFSFSTETDLYFGTGRVNGSSTTDFWKYDIIEDSWEQLDNFPGIARQYAEAFAIGGTAYVVSGYDVPVDLQDFWKYEIETMEWTQLPDLPFPGRSDATVLANGEKAYVCGGYGPNGVMNDFWEFDPITEDWTELTDYPGETHWRAFGFIIDDTCYIGGGGSTMTISQNGFYAYDIPSGEWTQLSECPSNRKAGGAGFALNGLGYYVEGTTFGDLGNATYKYDPATESWTSDTPFIGSFRMNPAVEVTNNAAYIGLGGDNFGTAFSDLYTVTSEETSEEVPSAISLENAESVQVFPNPITGERFTISGLDAPREWSMHLYNAAGVYLRDIGRIDQDQNSSNIHVGALKAGVYFLQMVHLEEGETKVLRLVKTQH